MLAVITLVALAAPAPAQEPKKPPLDFSLAKVEAERWEGRQVFIDCHVVLDNNTGKELAVRSNFTSAFDAMTIVIRDEKGKLLLKQGLAWHQSPFAPPGRLFPVLKGENKMELRFPVELPVEVTRIRVMVYGTLPESGHDDLLLTDVVTAEILPRK